MQRVGSVFGADTRVTGTLQVDESIRIDGKLDGNIEQTGGDERWLIVGPSAEINGDIRAQNVSVAGKVIGNIYASGNVELTNGSEVRGNISHLSITVEPGASVHGQLIAIDPPDTAAQSAAAPAASEQAN
jgi:cytoskeletal protein CcmA (bactofilin family)